MRPRDYFELASCGSGDREGLMLQSEEGRAGYWCTPLNADTFAATGGDGTHYSFLVLPDRSPDEYPVVMTVPMADECNVVVGGNLREFLALGCTYGYFALEQLVYGRHKTVLAIQSGRHAYDHSDDKFLTAICERFGLRPWPDVASRLQELRKEFQGLIQLPPEGLDQESTGSS